MVFDLEDGGFDAGITLEIKEQSTVVVTMKKGLSQLYLVTVRSE